MNCHDVFAVATSNSKQKLFDRKQQIFHKSYGLPVFISTKTLFKKSYSQFLKLKAKLETNNVPRISAK